MRPEEIISTVGMSLGIEPSVLKGNRRLRDICDARHMAAALLTYLGLNPTEIGRLLGGRDHTSILSGLRTHEDLIVTDFKYRTKYAAIKAAIEGEKEIPHASFDEVVREIPLTPFDKGGKVEKDGKVIGELVFQCDAERVEIYTDRVIIYRLF